jgi:8-oxo-dGTP diphosphatase
MAALAAAGADSPRVRVAALILLGGEVVLVRQRKGQRSYHLLPGGGVAYRETLEQALVREVLEETGLEVELGKALLINDTIDPHGRRHVVNITFEASIVGGSLNTVHTDSAIQTIDLVSPDALDQLDLRPPIAPQLMSILHGDVPKLQYLGPVFTVDETGEARP